MGFNSGFKWLTKNWRISTLWNKLYYKITDLFVATDFQTQTRGIHSYIVIVTVLKMCTSGSAP